MSNLSLRQTRLGLMLDGLRRALAEMDPVPDSEWHKFECLFREERLQKHAVFIREGSIPDSFVFVYSGLLRLFYTTDRGREYNKEFRWENEFLASYSAFNFKRPARFSVQAIEDTILLVAPYHEVEYLYQHSTYWQGIGRHLAERMVADKEEKEAQLLMDSPRCRYEQLQQKFPELISRLSDYHIASYLGITPIGFGRIKQNLGS